MQERKFDQRFQLTSHYKKENVIYRNWSLFDTDLPFSVLSAGVTLPDPRYLILQSSKNPCLGRMYTLEYILEGEGVIETENERLTVREGDLVFNPLKTECVYYADGKNPYKKYWINFRGTLLPDLLSLYGFPRPILVVSPPRERVEPLFSAILDRLSAMEKTDAPLVNAAVFDLVNRIFLEIVSSKNQNGTYELFTAETVKRIIDSAPVNDVTIREIAEAHHYSERQISRLFTEEYGVSPKEYILKKKIEHAKLLLTRTRSSLETIAATLRFYDVHHFCNCFKHLTGETPGAYRKRMAEEAPKS